MKNNKGFSLVELIVVIAIMAILAAVAVVGFSFYIPKAQMAGDRQTISDTIDAFTLHYYSNPDGVTVGYVVLGSDGAVKYDEFGDAAMKAAFGENWKTTVKLQYADWEGMTSTETYKDTSYKGNESDLLQTVGNLAGALGNAIKTDPRLEESLMGGGFGEFLEDYPTVDTSNGQSLGNVAVLYTAQKTKEQKDAILAGFETGLNKPMDEDPANDGTERLFNLFNAMTDEGVGTSAALAAIFAYAEGYAQSTDQADTFHENVDLTGVTTADQALAAMANAFNNMDGSKFSSYAYGEDAKGTQDLKGYIDMMGTVDQNKNIVSENLNNDDCFTNGNVSSLLNAYAVMSTLSISTQDGQVAILLTVDENGNMQTHVAPLNWDK